MENSILQKKATSAPGYADEASCKAKWGCATCGGCGEFWFDCDCVPVVRIIPGVRIKSGPTYLDGPDVWEIIVNLPVYSAKLAGAAFDKLPARVVIAGRTFTKAGMRANDCVAWYRSKGK